MSRISFDDALVCVHRGCKTLQGEDGEYCDAHYSIKK
jgi:hypothetical protein